MLATSLHIFITEPKNKLYKDFLDTIKKLHPEVYEKIDFDVKIFHYNPNLSQKDMGISDGETIGMIDDGIAQYPYTV